MFQEIQVLRFLGDTAAVSRHEAVLKFITDRKNATRQEIEAFYRQHIGALVSDIVDGEFEYIKNGMHSIVPGAVALSNIKNALTAFMLAPNASTYNNLLVVYRNGDVDGGALLLGFTMNEINEEVSSALANRRLLGTKAARGA